MPINYYCAIAMNGSDIEMNKNQLQLPVIDNESSAPSSPIKGQMYYDTGTNIMYFYNDTSWVEMDGTGSGVSSFKATDGTYIDYSPNTASTGAVTLTGDLSASGLTGDGSTQFLRGDNTWATPAGAYTSWELSADSGTAVDITDGLGVDFTGGEGINTTVASATPNTLTIDLDVNKLTSATPVKTDFLAFSDEDQTGDPTRKAKIETILALGGFLSNISAGSGLTKTGSASAPTLSVDYSDAGIINDANNGTSVVLADTDEFLFEDANGTAATAVMRGTLSQLKTYIGADNYGSWTLAGNTGDNQTISSTNTATFEGYAQDNALAGITTNGLNTDKLQIGLDQSKIASVSTAGATDYVLISDASTDANERIAIRDLHLNQFGDAEGTIDMGGNKILDVADPTLAQDAATKAYVDGLVTGGLTFKGTFRADTGEILSGDNDGSYIYNCPGGAGTRVAVAVGDYYVVASAGGSFYCSGDTLDIGDSIIGVTARGASQSVVTDWSIVQSDEGVTDFSATFGTFVSGTDKSSAVGSVDVGTIDLVDNGAGGSPSSSTFYAGDGNWRTPPNTQNPFQTISGTGSNNTDSGIILSDSGGTVLVLGSGSVSASQSGNTITLTGTDTNTTYQAGTGLTLDTTTTPDTFNVNVGATGTTQAPQSITTTANRLYQVETDDQDNLVVNVPWSDTNTNLVTSVDEDTTVAYKGIRVTPTTGDVKVGLDINGLTLVTPAGGDLIPLYDISGTPENKKATVTSLAPSIRSASTYAATITGFGTVDHDLGSYDVIVQLYNATTYENIFACVDRNSINQIAISGNSFPTGNIRVLVSLADAGA